MVGCSVRKPKGCSLPTITVTSKKNVHPADAAAVFQDVRKLTESFEGILLTDDDPVTVIFPCCSMHSSRPEMHTHVVVDELSFKLGYRSAQVCTAYGEAIGKLLLAGYAHVAYHTVTIHIRAFQGRTDITLICKKELEESPAAGKS